jgi:hypothetical protein
MAIANVNLKQYFRAAVTGSGYEVNDPRKVGEWQEKEAKALEDAPQLFMLYGTSTNLHLSRRVMPAEQAAVENAKRQSVIDQLHH